MSAKALEGIRVLDLSRILAAPFASQMLGDLGAEIVKVEQPGKGDDSRQYGPPFLDDASAGMSAFFLSCNRNKRALTLDFTTARGHDLLLDLIAQSDVVLENFRPGVLDKYGLGWANLHDRFPGLVMCSVTGFGQDGPYRHRPGYDGIFQAISGMMSVSGVPDGQPGAGPMKSGLSLIDILTGLYSTSAVLAALRHRDRTGEGQHLDVSLLDCGLASLSHFAEGFLVSGDIPQRRGNGGFGGIPSQAFECADGKLIFIVATTNPQFSRACEAFGRPLIEDPRFNSIAARIEHRLELLDVLDQIFLEQPREQWLVELEARDVPVGPVNNIAEALADQQVQFRQLQMAMHDDSLGEVAALRYPIQMSATPVTEYTFPPRLGEDTVVLYRELLGLDDDEIQKLAADHVI